MNTSSKKQRLEQMRTRKLIESWTWN